MQERPAALHRLYDLVRQDQQDQESRIGPHLPRKLAAGEASHPLRAGQQARQQEEQRHVETVPRIAPPAAPPPLAVDTRHDPPATPATEPFPQAPPPPIHPSPPLSPATTPT